MAQGKKPSFRISFIPEGDNGSWRDIGAVWATKTKAFTPARSSWFPWKRSPPASSHRRSGRRPGDGRVSALSSPSFNQ